MGFEEYLVRTSYLPSDLLERGLRWSGIVCTMGLPLALVRPQNPELFEPSNVLASRPMADRLIGHAAGTIGAAPGLGVVVCLCLCLCLCL